MDNRIRPLLGRALLCAALCFVLSARADDPRDSLRGIGQVKLQVGASLLGDDKGCDLSNSELETAAAYVLSNSRLRLDPAARDVVSIVVFATTIGDGRGRATACVAAIDIDLYANIDFTVRSTGKRSINSNVTIWHVLGSAASSPEDFRRQTMNAVEDMAKQFVVRWTAENP